MSGEGKGDTVLKVPCKIFSRVVGYLTSVDAWNEGKRQEFADRVEFALPARDKMLDIVTRVEAAKPEPEPGGFWLPDDWNEAALKLPGVEDERSHLDQ